jgi:ABC-type nitrate/sulfonate/bicarbonate transport system substrate-binding protein
MFDDTYSRRKILAGIGGATVGGLAGCAGASGGNSTDDSPTIGTARLSTGSTSLVAPVIEANGWDEDNGFELNTRVRDSISAYYGDFVAGTYGTLPFGVSSAASRYNGGVDMKLFAGFDYSAMHWLTNSEDIEGPQDFEGRTIAAPLASGSFQVANSVVKEVTGSSVEALAGNLVNASGPANPLNELATGSADVALSWEPALSTFLVREDTSARVIVDVRERYREAFDADSFHLLWGIKTSILENNREAVEGLVEASGQVGDLYADNPDEALDTVVENTDNERDPLEEAVDSGRMEFALTGLSDLRSDVQTQFEVFAELDIIDEVPDEDIYADI